MAVFKPSLGDLGQLVTPLNVGEHCVARALSSLDDGWTIYVQPRIAHDIPDFVAVHDHYGVCAIEVKDWANAGYRQADDGAVEFSSCTQRVGPGPPRCPATRRTATARRSSISSLRSLAITRGPLSPCVRLSSSLGTRMKVPGRCSNDRA